MRGGRNLSQRITQCRRIFLGRQRFQAHLDKFCRRILRVPNHIPEAEPDDGTSQRIVESVKIFFGKRPGLFVKTQFRISQIIIIYEDKIGSFLACCLRDLRFFAVNVGFETVCAHDFPVRLIIKADCNAVSAKNRLALPRHKFRRLRQRHIGNCAVFVRFDFRQNRIYAGLFKPQFRPLRQVAPGRSLQFGKQIGKAGVRICIFLQIIVNAVEELFSSDICDNLLENRSSFCICDSVEVYVCVVQIVNRSSNRVGCGKLVDALSPAFFARVECRPCSIPLSRFRSAQSRHKFCE